MSFPFLRTILSAVVAIQIVSLSKADAPAEANSEATIEANIGEGAAEPNSPKEWYGEGIRTSEKRSPEEERVGFHLPIGFEIDLIASEPSIAKPLNMAFDSVGKLWITQTVEYPYPAEVDSPARDCVKTLEDTDGDGSFDRVTTFADRLNIPIGILPYADGVIVFSIPNLIHLRDLDGDGVCDRRDIILGPFDTTRDTHGMVNALRRGDDGWVYACHGFNNHSIVAGSDGHKITMTSGNTFRFRPDGSRVELVSQGQVNPFGMTVDKWGNRFSADCHSKPITCVVRNACYPSFGRPHDGLGFFPSMMDHLHGSTAISGICLYDAEEFPEPYRNQLYSGNVMTSRINRDAIKRTGATFAASEVDDFLTSDDPWFRPVDIQLGPDGAIYVADFYNRIIGHYEVPLEHPGRDRDSGRIWRIRYRSPGDIPTSDSSFVEINSSQESLESMFDRFADANATQRRLALDTLTDRFFNEPNVREGTTENGFANMTEKGLVSPAAFVRANTMWLLHQTHRLTSDHMVSLLKDPEPLVRHNALRRLTESIDVIDSDCLSATLPIVRELLNDPEPMVVATTAQVMAVHGNASDAQRIIDRIKVVPADDPMLLARLRIALRDLISHDQECLLLAGSETSSAEDREAFMDILLGIRTTAVSEVIFANLQKSQRPLSGLLPWIEHTARYGTDQIVTELVKMVRARTEQSESDRRLMFVRLKDSTVGRSNAELTSWADSVVSDALRYVQGDIDSDTIPLLWSADKKWGQESRRSLDEQKNEFTSSLPLGERYTGTLRSGDFVAIGTISFWLLGHNGQPPEADQRLNCVRLVDASTNERLIEAFPPRSDVGVKVEWDLNAWSGRSVAVEVKDADSGPSFAWIGVGRFDPVRLNPISSFNDEWTNAMDLISQYKLGSHTESLLRFASIQKLGQRRRLEATAAYAEQAGDVPMKIVAENLLRFSANSPLSDAFLGVISQQSGSDATAVSERRGKYKEILRGLCKTLAQRDQLSIAHALASNKELSVWLVDAMEDGWLSNDLLNDKSISTSLESTIGEVNRSRLSELQASSIKQDDLSELRTAILKMATAKPGDLANGTSLFQKHCAICHQLGGQGALIGPQLDGIGSRGFERLLEDILLPDRNVDKAFRTTSFLLENGTVQTGLIRSQSELVIEFVDVTGKVQSVEVSEIESQRSSGKSLMPDGQQATLGPEGMVDLLVYLQSSTKSTKGASDSTVPR